MRRSAVPGERNARGIYTRLETKNKPTHNDVRVITIVSRAVARRSRTRTRPRQVVVKVTPLSPRVTRPLQNRT